MKINPDQLRDVVTRLITELLADSPAPRPRVLALFSGASIGFTQAIESLHRLGGRADIGVTQTTAAKHILDQAAIERLTESHPDHGLVVEHDILVIPTLTVNLAGKVVHGVGDCLASNVTAEFIMAGKPVVAARNAADPDDVNKSALFPTMPPGYAEMLRANLSTLESFGVRLVDASELDRAVLAVAGQGVGLDTSKATVEVPDRLVTAATIKGLTAGTEVLLAKGAQVTALARDAAASAGITITERN